MAKEARRNVAQRQKATIAVALANDNLPVVADATLVAVGGAGNGGSNKSENGKMVLHGGETTKVVFR